MDKTATATDHIPVPSLDATIQRFVQELAAQGGPPLHTLSPEEARAVLAGLQTGQVLRFDAGSEDCTISAGPTGEIALRIVRPPASPGPLPAVVYFHGGGWVLGDRETHDRLVREIAVGAHVAVVFVDYARSPEAHYPVAIEQAYAATRWVAENGESINVDPSRLVLMGDGVGGNMVAAVTLLARERGGPPIRFQVLFCPVTDADFETPSYRQFAEGPWLTRKAMELFWNSYAPDVEVRSCSDGRAAAGSPRAAREPPARPGDDRRGGCGPRRGRSLRSQATRGRSAGDGRAVSRGHSRLRAAQSDCAQPANPCSHHSDDRRGPRCRRTLTRTRGVDR